MKENKNVVFLPNFLPPESYLYSIIYDYTKNEISNLSFWRQLDKSQKTFHYTTDYITEHIIDTTPLTNNGLKEKKVSEEMFKFCEESSILIDYYNKEEHKDELKHFIEHFSKVLSFINKKLKASRI